MSAPYFPVDEADGATCGWLVRVPNDNPEPDSPEDCYDIVECGAPLERNRFWSWRCAAGHHHVAMEDPDYAADEAAFAAWEREQG